MSKGDLKGVEAAVRLGPCWETVVSLSMAHQVAGSCYWNARNVPANVRLVPEDVLEAWKTAYKVATLNVQVVLSWFLPVHRALSREGIESLLLKGPWIALAAYPSPGMRPIGDIDLCVRERDYEAALEVLGACGYRLAGRRPATGLEALRMSHYGSQLRFSRPRSPTIELHFRLINVGRPAPDEEWVWETARTMDIKGSAVAVPGSVAMLLNVVLHANQHGFSPLRLLHDIRWVLEHDRDGLDTGLFVERVRTLRCHSTAYFALQLARELAGADVPGTLIDGTLPARLRRWVFQAAWRLPAVRRLEAPRWPESLESPRLAVLELGGFTDKLHYVLEVTREAGGLAGAVGRALGAMAGLSRRRSG